MRGEFLGRDFRVGMGAMADFNVGSALGMDGEKEKESVAAAAGEWQDKSVYEQEQEVVQGEIGNRDAALPVDVDATAGVDGAGGGAAAVDGGEGKSKQDKEERKRRKKERGKQEARARQANLEKGEE